jgi:hypothetical protein
LQRVRELVWERLLRRVHVRRRQAGGRPSVGSGTASGVSALDPLPSPSRARPLHAAGTPARARGHAATPARARRALRPADLDPGREDSGVYALPQDVRLAAPSVLLLPLVCVLGVPGDGESHLSCSRGGPGLTAVRTDVLQLRDEREGVEQSLAGAEPLLPKSELQSSYLTPGTSAYPCPRWCSRRRPPPPRPRARSAPRSCSAAAATPRRSVRAPLAR